MKDLADIGVEIVQECARASARFPPFNSAHEGYAVLLEEVDELWEEIKTNQRIPEIHCRLMRAEAIQIGAMAMRFVNDICDKGDPS